MHACSFPPAPSARSRRLSVLISALLAVSIASSAAASGLDPLSGLDLPVGPETVLVSGDGRLVFSSFAIFGQGELDPDQVEGLSFSPTTSGLVIGGPLSVADGAEAALYVRYQVAIATSAIQGVRLAADTSIVEGGFPTFAKTEKLIFAGETPELLSAADLLAHLRTRNFAGEQVSADSAGFAGQGTLTVLEAIRLASGGPGGSATLFSLTNEFSSLPLTVPEPGPALLILLGLAGLTVVGRGRG